MIACALNAFEVTPEPGTPCLPWFLGLLASAWAAHDDRVGDQRMRVKRPKP